MNPYSIKKTPHDILLLTAEQHRRLRKKKKFTQQALADRSGVSLGSLKRFEQTGQVSFENLLKLALILGRLEEFEDLLFVENSLEEIEKLFSKKVRR